MAPVAPFIGRGCTIGDRATIYGCTIYNMLVGIRAINERWRLSARIVSSEQALW